MRILHVYKDSYPPVRGGIEQHIDLLAGLQASAGHDVEVLVAGSQRGIEIEHRNGFVVRRLPEITRAASSPVTFAYGRALHTSRPDIAHFHHPNPIAELYSPLLGPNVRTAVSYHADITRQRVLRAIYGPALRAFLARTDIVITSSERLRETSPMLAPHRERCYVVPYGVPASPLPPVARRRSSVLFVGRMREYKGLPVLLEALARAPSVRLRLVGGGPERGRLDDEVRRLGLERRVEFLGDLDDAALDRELRQTRAVVLPSTRRSEAFGIVLLEALHRATPLVTTELGTGTSWVNQDGQTGFVVAPGDPDALARALARLTDSDDLWERMSAGAAQRALMFTPERMLDGIMAAYAGAK
jgi:glycosyltransferase involved in cell wall biosynthesis